MNKYDVSVTYTSSDTLFVQADNEKEAERIAKKYYATRYIKTNSVKLSNQRGRFLKAEEVDK
jgi:hypothetical protein|tara:strand:+ start:321 stop:506 length:186 start_codon:yes stop_codon:yes gene_type:complete